MHQYHPTINVVVNGDRKHLPLVLGHPLGMSLRAWEDVAIALSEHYFVVRWDLPGHGQSNPVAKSKEQLNELDLLNQIIQICAALEIKKFHYAGTSIGGMIGQQLAIHYPDKLLSLTLTNTGAKIGTNEAWLQRKKDVNNKGLTTMSEAIVTRWFSPKTISANPQIKIDWQQRLSNTDEHSYGLLCAWLGQRDHYNVLKPCSFPMNFVAGKDDVATPPDLVRELAYLLGNNDVIQLSGVGHVPSVEAPASMIKILQHPEKMKM
jgi:3-oxoadipate enol-lactonase